jgi:hypothetical protein
MQLVGIGPMRPIGRLGPMRYIPITSQKRAPDTEERIPTGFRRN